MIDIPGIYVGRFKDDPNQSTMFMQTNDTPTYTDDNWANVESTGTIWRYNAKAGEWIDTGLEEILVEEVSGTKEIVAEGTVPWKLQGLNVYGKSTQDGMPSPDSPVPIVTAGSDGSIDITVSDGADQSQQLIIQTPNGLPGIPVDSGGNFTDADGQQWICDEVDFARGMYVQQVGKVIIDGTTLSFEAPPDSLFWNLPGDSAPHAVGPISPTLITHFPSGVFQFNATFDFMFAIPDLMSAYFETADALNQFCVKENSKGNPLTVYYIYDESQETPLSAEELATYAALRSYDDRTIISTDEDVSGISAKVVTDVISKNAWFDPYAELALYYKALAGFESLDNLPMPHSRESSLVRKLLDSSYELGFSVNENSSRNERYLWDLINGTSTMLTNVPKSDTEKFLHVMIGGTVEEYPVVDTELDYWMDKCVHYMSSNGNIGG